MPTPAYTELNSNKPSGGDSPTTYAGNDLDNVRALRDLGMGLLAQGFVQSRTTGTGPGVERPQYVTWLNASLSVGFRWKLTWGGTGNWQITAIEMEWSNDNGSSWTSVRTAQANTLDSAGNITATTNSGGAWTMVLELWGKVVKAVSDVAAHIAATGTAVHGLGTMSTQAKTAVDIDGGTIDGTTIGASAASDVDAKRVREDFHDYGSIANGATVTLELDKYAHFAFTPSSTTSHTVTIAVSGAPASGKAQVWTLEILNGQRSADAKITWPGAAKWIGGSAARLPDTALELSGRNLFIFQTRDGGTRLEIQHIGKGG